METSEKIDSISKAMLYFQSRIGVVKKDAKNPHFNKQYATLTGIKDEINSHLIECGLLITQHPNENGTLQTMLIHVESGQWMRSTILIPAQSTAQAVGSALTYARRYALSAILFLTTEDDDDANGAMPSKPQAKPIQKPATPAEAKKKMTEDQYKKAKAFTSAQLAKTLAIYDMPDQWRSNLEQAQAYAAQMEKEASK